MDPWIYFRSRPGYAEEPSGLAGLSDRRNLHQFWLGNSFKRKYRPASRRGSGSYKRSPLQGVERGPTPAAAAPGRSYKGRKGSATVASGLQNRPDRSAGVSSG